MRTRVSDWPHQLDNDADRRGVVTARCLGYYNLMRKAIALTIVGVLALTAVACGSEDPTATTAPTATSVSQPTEAMPPTPESRETPASTATQPPAPTPEPEMQHSAEVGDMAPVFTLPSASGTDVSLESYRGDKNVVLVYYRGSF